MSALEHREGGGERGASGDPAALPAPRIRLTITMDCGHKLTYFDSIDEKYPFWCDACEDYCRDGKYPWRLAAEIVP